MWCLFEFVQAFLSHTFCDVTMQLIAITLQEPDLAVENLA